MKTLNLTLIILAIIVSMAGDGFASTGAGATDSYKYVIHLAPSDPLHQLCIASKPELNHYKLYSIRRETPSMLTYDIRLGFFETRAQAKSILQELEKYDINGTVDTIKADELHILIQWWQQLTVTTETKSPTLDSEAVYVGYLMDIADQAMRDKKYNKAIGLYTKIINTENKDSQSVSQNKLPPEKLAREKLAREKLALARERNKQFAHAKAEYLVYLDRYPGGEGAVRVRRRLNRLITQQVPGVLTSSSSQADGQEVKWQHDGNLYQFYHRNTIDVAEEGTFTANSVLSTNINYIGRTINNPAPIEINITATHLHDTENSADDEERVSSMYIDITSENSLYDIKLGRQKHKDTSLFNRFDGVEAGYMISPDYKIKLILGYPVEYNETVEDSKDKYFYSAAVTLFPDSAAWKTGLYYLEQKADGVLDRQELAVDTRKHSKQSSFYSIVDYSLQYDTLNLFLATFNKRYQDKSSLSIAANYRKNPFLTTTNALLGQAGMSSIEDLLGIYTEDEIEQLSLDRTAIYKSLSAYYMRHVNSDVQITTDVTASSMSGTVASAGVEAIQDTGNEYSYSLGVIRKNLFTKDDMNIINLRRNKLASSNQWLLSLSSRFRIDRDWLIKPGLAYDARNYNDGRTSIGIRPSITIRNKINRHWQFEMEMAYADKDTDMPGNATTNGTTSETTAETNRQFYAGYMYTF